ncbi:hypothetical protein [Kutzneria sp. NPDC052558]|uniref:hypothetical protein n=1 Tax=Kutzneria sp. NPDC052558 TaxID=3364121 RepID=UPI0037C92F54
MNAKAQAKQIQEQAEQAAAQAKDTAAQAKNTATQAAAQAKDTAAQTAAQVRDTATQALDQAERKIDDLPEAVREPAHRTLDVVRQRPGLVLAGLAGLILVLRLLLRRNRG